MFVICKKLEFVLNVITSTADNIIGCLSWLSGWVQIKIFL